jgi:outer membrane receptor protein involved in Fe transport
MRFFFLFMVVVLFRTVLLPAEIKGIVKDHKKNPLAAVKVIVKKTGATTTTDLEGKFALTLSVPDKVKSVVLIFDRFGYYPHEERVRVSDRVQVFKIVFISKEYIREKISVTALNQEKETISIPMAETSVSSLEIQEKISESIAETLSDTPGVHFIGKGGFSVTPSIRGLARRRVLVLVDGIRVTSDRRVGSSASFVLPEMAKRIEVVRSSASVLYGSDAIGGVVNILTRPSDIYKEANLQMNALNLNVSSVDKRVNTGITYGLDSGKWHLYTGFQFSRASDYSSPNERILYSSYRYYSGIFDISLADEQRDFYLGYVGGSGQDIGKPERANDPDKYSIVPSESEHIIRFGYNEKKLIKNSTLHFSLFLNPSTYILDNGDTKKDTIQHSDTRVLNLGLKTSLRKFLSQSFSYQVGVEWFSRQNLRIENRDEIGGSVNTTFPLRKGRRNDYSLFLTLNYKVAPTIDIDAGIRYTFFSIDADVEGTREEKSSSSSSFFLGIIKKITPSMSLFCNVGRAFRLPSLSESFYTGITGRNYVVGNPLLEPESSFNIDTGLKISPKNNKYFIGFYLFSNWINHLIERYRNEEDITTYDNIQRGRIFGVEMEAQFCPIKNVTLFGHYFYYRGRSDIGDKEPLNDVPAPRLVVGGKVFFNRLWFEGNFLHSFRKGDPGPAEVENDAYNVLNLIGGYYLSSQLFIYVKVSNLLNEVYYSNPDPDIPEAKGLSFSTGIHFYF